MVALPVTIPGQIGSYIDLQNLVAAYMDRDDLQDRLPVFIALAESRLNRLLRTVNQEFRAIWTIDSESWEMPSDFRRLRKIHIEGMPDRPLVEINPQSVAFNFSGAAGIPTAYFIEGRTITFAPPPADETDFRVTYWRRIPPLTVAEDTNWLLEEHGDIYLFAALLEASIYIRDPDAISLCSDRLDQAIAELQQESRLDRHGGGPLAPTVIRQVRGARC